jgi:hypothetical protein
VTETNTTTAPPELAHFTDALGRVVTATIARSGILVILTRDPGSGLRGGHPALDRESAAELRDALTEFIGSGP